MDTMRRHGIKATIPSKSDQDAHRRAKGSASGRRPAFDPEIYKQRHTIGSPVNAVAWVGGLQAVPPPRRKDWPPAGCQGFAARRRSRCGTARTCHRNAWSPRRHHLLWLPDLAHDLRRRPIDILIPQPRPVSHVDKERSVLLLEDRCS
jgi:hypothetical protein